MRDFDDRVAVFIGEMAETAKQIDLGANIKMQRRFIEQQDKRLLRQSASQDDTLFLSAGDFMHPAIA